MLWCRMAFRECIDNVTNAYSRAKDRILRALNVISGRLHCSAEAWVVLTGGVSRQGECTRSVPKTKSSERQHMCDLRWKGGVFTTAKSNALADEFAGFFF